MVCFTLLLLVLFSCGFAAENLDSPNNQSNLLAFSADLSADVIISPGAPIVFDRVHSNVGGLYFNTSGQFACPDGLYVFIWNLMKASIEELPGMRSIGSLRKGGSDLKYGPKTSYIDTEWSSVSEMSTIHECYTSPPAAVTVTTKPWSGGISSKLFERYTTFSGFNLQTGIAFSVELSQDQLAPPGSRIMFDTILANYGNHFELTHGSFRCPDDGVYVFGVSTYTRNPATPWSVSRLMMEREVIRQGPITNIATDEHDSGSASTTTVLQCVQGFSVYVEAQAAYNFTFNSYGAELTSFIGFKLYNSNSDAVAFTVVMTQNLTIGTVGQPIPFDDVITNIGNAFDNSSNRVVCLDDAHYLFTWSIVSTDSIAYIDLYLSGSSVKELVSRSPGSPEDTGTSGSSTMSVILKCQPGSSLYLAGRTQGHQILGGYVSFSGYRLPG